MTTKLILISGKQGSGKTTLTNNLIPQLSKTFESVVHLKFANPIYEIHDATLNIMKKYGVESKLIKDGNLMQLIGTEWGRKTLKESIWIDILIEHILQIDKQAATHGDKSVILVDDCRFENEITIFKENSFTIRLQCPMRIRKQRADMWRDNNIHASEIGLDVWERNNLFDLVIDTNKNNIEECAHIAINNFYRHGT